MSLTLDLLILSLCVTFLASNYVPILNEYLTSHFNSEIFKLVLENGFFTAISFTGAIYLSIITGCFDSFEWYQLQKQRSLKVASVYEKINSSIELFFPSSKKSSDTKVETYHLHTTKKAVKITYVKGGKENEIYLPYHPEVATAMRRFQARLITSIKSGGYQITYITQQAGLPYLTTAAQLGGDKFEIFDTVNNAVAKTLTKDQVPTVEMFKKLSSVQM